MTCASKAHPHRKHARPAGAGSQSPLKRFFAPLTLLTLLFLAGPALARPAAPPSDLYLFAIGIGTYADSHIPTRPFAADDARVLEQVAHLQEHKFSANVHTKVMIDAEVTRDQLLEQLDAFFRPARARDQRIIFIAAQGVKDPSAGRWYLLPHDARLEQLDETALDQAKLLERLAAIPVAEDTAGDAANANGAASDPARANGVPPRAAGERTSSDPGHTSAPASPPRWLLLVDTHPSLSPSELLGIPVRVPDRSGKIWSELGSIDEVWPAGSATFTQITAGPSRGDERTGERRKLAIDPAGVTGHSLFGYTLLQALSTTMADRDADGLISPSELQTYLTETIQKQTGGSQIPERSGATLTGVLTWAPGSLEVCNGVDDNGDGRIDEGFDQDKDGYLSKELCHNAYGDDCDDHDPTVHPGQRDLADLKDNDCDGLIDEDDLDLNNNHIPDSIETHSRHLKQARWSAIGVGAALLVGAGVTYQQLSALRPANGGSYNIGALDGPTIARYQNLSLASVGLAGAAVLGAGLAIEFELRGRRFDVQYLKPQIPVER